jgi:hypothetical protein
MVHITIAPIRVKAFTVLFIFFNHPSMIQPGAKLQQARYYNVFMVNTPNIQFGYYPSYCLGC